MLTKNYYVILGVPQGETPAGIRTAYHELAARIHSDIAGPAGAEINEAYEVLSDPTRKRVHDHEFESDPGAIPTAPRPIVPEPISLFEQPEQTKPSFDAFHERFLRNFTGWRTPKAERVESLTLDVAISPVEAFQGCAIPVGVPFFEACPECGGTGRVPPFRCTACGGSGLKEEQRTLLVRVPPQVAPGAVLEVALDMLAIRNLYLRVHVSITDAL